MVMKLSSPGIDLGIVVSDLDQSLHFYRGLLGLHHEGSNPVPGGGTMHRLWAAESMIKLVAPESPPDQPVIAGGLARRARRAALLHVLGGGSRRVDGRSQGQRRAGDPRRDRDGAGVRIAIVEDPDGNHVEFLERR